MLPSGYGLTRSLAPQRTIMRWLSAVAAQRDTDTVAVTADVSVRLHRPPALPEPAPALLWLHGGGYVMGSARQEDTYCRRLAHLAQVNVIAVEYRLAPENPYPAALEDSYSALLWLARQPWADASRLAIGGASAGGGLAAALALLARDRNEVHPACQLLAYPMLDDRTGRQTDHRRRIMWSANDNQQAWQWYLHTGEPGTAVPARRNDLAGLPPAWIGVGTLDLFLSEGERYAQRLREAGIPCHTEIVAGAYHAFDMIRPASSPSLAFFASQCEYLRTTLSVSTAVTAADDGRI